MQNSSSFFSNTACEFFPCHKAADTEQFNCLFCFCPLYGRDDCGGSFKVLPNGTKDCSDCLLPHRPEAYEYIINKLSK
jgi:Zn-finger protein